ncbi:MAG: rod shape-determining protein MreC, partial [Candidatus Cloacimonetes bacterium]|nr:rod shape-determining protein MreC [Candidatus Cloacimonadota bacterium]
MKKVFLTLIGFSLFLMVFDQTIGFSLLRDFTQMIFSPIEIGLHGSGLLAYDKIVFLTKLPLIYRENQELKTEVNNLQSLLMENQILQNKNKVLKEQLGVEIKDYKVQAFAQVLGQKVEGEKVFILIGKGRAEGVSVGDIVVLRKFLVGRVSFVTSHKAEVLPIFSQASKVPVYVFSSGRKVSGLAVGEYNSR